MSTERYRHPNESSRRANIYEKWNAMIRGGTATVAHREPTIQQFASRFSYEILEQIYPRTKTFRAGVILIHRAKTNIESGALSIMKMLMVRQRQTSFQDTRKTLPPRFGFPKGARETTDKTAFETAHRELYEETGINMFDKSLEAQVCMSTLIIPRPAPTSEIIIYFIVIVETKLPFVHICDDELDDYIWADMMTGLRDIKPTTTSTNIVLQQIKNMDFCGPIKRIPM